MPVEKRPDAVPRVALFPRVLRLPGLRIDTAIESMAPRRIVIHHRLGQPRFTRAQRIDQLHVLLDVHVLIVLRDADVQRNLQLVHAVERRAVLVDVVPVRGKASEAILRIDQLMNFAWKFMLPMALINIVAAGLWRFLPSGFERWVVCSAILAVPYVLLGKGLAGGKQFAKRTYRYAE